MHDKRNFVLLLLLVVAVVWAIVALIILNDDAVLLGTQRIISVSLVVLLGAYITYAFVFEDKLDDNLQQVVGPMYYEADGLCFMPIVRIHQGQAELCVYYQNRFEGYVHGVVHLRPPEDCFVIRSGMRDVHIAFQAGGGDFGVIHQPIAVPDHLQGEVLNILLAAASYYPHGHGSRLRRKPGMTCGSLLVDWSGAAFKTGVHEVSGEIDLRNPSTLHLSMPQSVNSTATGQEVWRQEQLAAGVAT